MLHPDFPYPLYLVISEKHCIYFPFLEVAKQALEAGIRVIQLREKDCSTAQYITKAEQLKRLTDLYDAKLIINDSLEVTKAVQAWGIHVGQNDISPNKIVQNTNNIQCIGWSIENEKQLLQEDLKHVNYLGVSPIFSTPTKTDTTTEWGLQGLKKMRQLTKLPLIAIGGVNVDNLEQIIKSGANSIAVVSAICASKNPYLSTRQLKNKIDDFI